MHHIAFYSSCIALFICVHLLHIHVDYVESKMENKAEQVQWVYGYPQASSCEDTNIA
jgi:hypothetical protein